MVERDGLGLAQTAQQLTNVFQQLLVLLQKLLSLFLNIHINYPHQYPRKAGQPSTRYLQCVPKNEIRVILNILYSCKSIAMKSST